MDKEVKIIWDRLSNIEKAFMPRNPGYYEGEISLSFSKALLNELISGDTWVHKMQSYEWLTDLYGHLDGFIYAVDGRGNNDTTKCYLFPTTLKG